MSYEKYILKSAEVRLDNPDIIDVLVRASDEYSTKIKIVLPSDQVLDIYITPDSIESPVVYTNLRDIEVED